jgi:hypothetical protein
MWEIERTGQCLWIGRTGANAATAIHGRDRPNQYWAKFTKNLRIVDVTRVTLAIK